MFRIGITYSIESGLTQTARTLSELFKKLGYETQLIDIYYDSHTKLHEISGLDLLIDIDGLIPEYRTRLAKKTVIFLRNFIQFAELDHSVYPEIPYVHKDYHVHEIWCWDILNPIETLDSVQALFPCPIKTVPFTWSPPMETYTGVYTNCVHISEKGDNTSSPVLPLVAIRELSKLDLTFTVHMDKENRFLKENILDNIEIDTFPVTFADKEPYHTMSGIILSHSRFVPIRIGLLNAIWFGIPVIHNSPILKTILDGMFYSSNSISEMYDVCKRFLSNPVQDLPRIRQSILTKWGIDAHLSEWKTILENVLPPSPIPPPSSSISSSSPSLIIAFSDMWPGFNYNTNFIMDALRHTSTISMKGMKYDPLHVPHILLFGPYSQVWKSAPTSIPKVFFSCENWGEFTDHVSLYITSVKKDIHIPTWMTFIDWFSGSTVLPESEDNPIRIPLHFATTSHPISFEQREKFCGFVVSNPICTFRNEVFHAVHRYKHVDSGGALYNNIGGQLALTYPGGGCGDISKHHFFKEHRFTLSFENSQAPGYITEKVLHSKMAGCVPIYWGDKDDFVPGSIVNISHIKDPDKIVEIIKKLEENPTLCSKIASLPLLDESRVQKALGMIKNMATKILELAFIPHIDKVFLINLDSRPDRLAGLEPLPMTRVPAVNGKTLRMNDMIYNLFKHNTFGWKKSVIGCSLSHISIWTSILKETGTHFLILEDDVRFTKGWKKDWSQYAPYIPEDADILYIGGVLPPNKGVLPLCLAPVNKYWSRIKPNTYFSSTPMPIFHFCTYSYIISKKGAQKLLQYLYESEKKSFCAVDHLLGCVGLTTYVSNSLLCYCFQENDPHYMMSQFNDSPKLFDSDIYNNTERFIIIYTMDTPYEQLWLREIFGEIYFESLPLHPTPNSWFIVQRPYLEIYNEYFKQLTCDFNVIHLSDELCIDDISFYRLPNCKVFRNYIRNITNATNVTTIPLGFHYKGKNRPFADREYVWSFHGTNWFHRKETLETLSEFKHSCHFTPEWNHSTMTKEDTYLEILENSMFCPVLRGNNFETFRLYECLEAGTIPLYIRNEGDDLFWSFISKLGLLSITDNIVGVIRDFIKNPSKAETYRQTLMKQWDIWKCEIKSNLLS